MTRMPMSAAAAGLLRSLLGRIGEDRHRILLTEIRSADWQSLTFVGERHELRFRIAGRGADALFDRFTGGLVDTEFSVRGHIVADVALRASSNRHPDGPIMVEIEALTIAE